MTKYVRAVMMIQRNSLPTPMMPPILVSRVRGGMVRWDLVTSTLRSKVTNNPYLSRRLSNPILTGCLVPQSFRIEDGDDKQGILIYQEVSHGGGHLLLSALSFMIEAKKKSRFSPAALINEKIMTKI